MTILNLLAVTADKQPVTIVNTENKVLKQGSSTWMWDNNIYHEKNIIHLWIKENILYLMIKE